MKIRFIGTIINQLRIENNLSIEELSARTGIPSARLAIIESGEAIPSISSMIRISHALGARLGTLIDGQQNASAVVTRASQIEQGRVGDVVDAQSAGEQGGRNRQLDFYSLAQGMKNRSMEPIIIDVEEGKVEFNSEHQGEEFVYIIAGSVDVNHGQTRYTLNAGDSIYYDSAMPHSMSNSSAAPARVLAVIYTPY